MKIINKPENKNDVSVLNQSIYQILPVEYLDSILINQKLRFNNILKSWKDPYELFLFRNPQIMPDEAKSTIDSLKNSFFGQCWSTRKNSDAMWRIYSYDKRSARIKTSVGKIVDALSNDFSNVYVGWVRYLSQKAVRKMIEQEYNNRTWFQNREQIIESLFIKRTAFDHEKEVRVIIDENNISGVKCIEVKIDTNSFIEEIAFDPRIDRNQFECKKKIYGKWFPSEKIVRSDLYTNPK